MNFKKTALIAAAGTTLTGLFYYAFSDGSEYLATARIPRADSNVAGQAQHASPVDERRQDCSTMLLASPFDRAKENCGPSQDPAAAANAAQAAARAVAVSNEVVSLNAHLKQMKPCEGAQQLSTAPIECARLNARAIGMVRQLETLVEQGNPQARSELAGLVKQHDAKATTNELRYELERAAAILQQPSAGGMQTESTIEQPPQSINPRLMAQYGEY